MKNNKLAIVSLSMAIIAIVTSMIWPDGNTVVIGCVICLVLAVLSIILGIIGRKQIKKSNEKGKGLALAGIIVGVITILWISLTLLGYMAMKDINYNDAVLCSMDNYVNECVDNGDGTSSCMYMEAIEIPCSTSILKDNQFKK